MKILWLSTQHILSADSTGTGNWQQTMASMLADTDGIDALHCIIQADVPTLTHTEEGKRHQWLVPRARKNTPFPPAWVDQLWDVIRDISPDLIQVWGIENVWGQLTAQPRAPVPTLVTIQGVKRAIAPVYSGGLSVQEALACIGIKELLRRSTMFQNQRKFAAWGHVEESIIAQHKSFAVQTPWQEAQVRAINPAAQVLQNDLIIRPAFFQIPPWQPPDNQVLFCSISYPAPFKGLHVALRALSILKQIFPDVQLHIAGALQRPGLRQEGYITWINRQAKALNVADRITWLGGMTAPQLIRELNKARAAIIPSYIESYSMTALEIALAGVPLVASYTGGIPALLRDKESVLFFTPGDDMMCAYQLGQLLSDPALSATLSTQGRASAMARGNSERIMHRELDIYRTVIGAYQATANG